MILVHLTGCVTVDLPLSPLNFTVMGLVPGAVETDWVLLTTCAHPVWLRLRLPAFLFLCYIHLGSGSGPGEPSVMQKLSLAHTHTHTWNDLLYIWQTIMVTGAQLCITRRSRSVNSRSIFHLLFCVLWIELCNSLWFVVSDVVLWFMVMCWTLTKETEVSLCPTSDWPPPIISGSCKDMWNWLKWCQ